MQTNGHRPVDTWIRKAEKFVNQKIVKIKLTNRMKIHDELEKIEFYPS